MLCASMGDRGYLFSSERVIIPSEKSKARKFFRRIQDEIRRICRIKNRVSVLGFQQVFTAYPETDGSQKNESPVRI